MTAAGLEIPVGGTAGAESRWCPVRPPYGPPEQFAAGRRAATAALAAVGRPCHIVPRGPGGRPRFPRGFAGSISHTESLAVALVVPGAEAVGVDIENADISPRVARFVLRGQERQMLLAPAGEFTARELFAAKEAAFKALYDVGELGNFLFWQVELSQRDGALIASYRGVAAGVWVRSEGDLSLAGAIRW